ncbi:MAG: DUF2179 domain-containing protein [Caldithrix sp.]|nr:DUF2179 domain-containing protein [Caldithrix sp.]
MSINEWVNLPLSANIIHYVIIPLFIFVARIVDVSIGTIRIIMISRGNRFTASVMGFFEIIIWLGAIAQIFQNLNNVVCYIAYGGGFAMGNYIGISIENRLALGVQAVQIITADNLKTLSMVLREEGFGVTNLKANGQKGELDFIHIITPRRRTRQVLQIVNQFDPKAFVSVTDIRSAHAGYFGVKTRTSWWPRGIVKKK